MGKAIAMFIWVLVCKNCGKDFTFSDVDELHPRQATNNMSEDNPPSRPRFKSGELVCPHCNESAVYHGRELQFRAN